jgi:VanZ family protein
MKLRKAISILPIIIYSTAIFYASHQPTPFTPDLGLHWQDKLYHFSAYFFYGFAVLFALPAVFPRISGRKAMLVIIVAVMFYGASDEIHQYFIPGRSCELLDWCADALGGIAAAVVARFFVGKRGE